MYEKISKFCEWKGKTVEPPKHNSQYLFTKKDNIYLNSWTKFPLWLITVITGKNNRQPSKLPSPGDPQTATYYELSWNLSISRAKAYRLLLEK